MSLRRSLAPSIRAIDPALFLVGLAVVALQTVLYLGLTVLTSALGSVYAPVSSLVNPFLVLLVTLPLAVGFYVPVRERTDGVGETVRAAVRGVRRYYVRILAATAAAFFGAAAIALVCTAVTVALVTAVQYGLYTLADPGPPPVFLTTWGLPLLLVCFLAVGILLTRFADVYAAFGEQAPRVAWRSSLSFARREPLSFLGYAAVVAVLLGTGQVLPFALGSADSVPAVVAAVGAVAVVSAVGLVLASAFHVTYYEQTVDPVVEATTARRFHWSRVAVAGVVLVAAVAGAGYVRTADLGVGQGEMRDLPEDPHAAYPVAANNTANANHRYVLEMRNESDPDATFRTVERTGVDYDDRQRYVYIHGDDLVLGGYFAEGTMATMNGGEAYGLQSSLAPFERQAGNWSVLALPGYGIVAPSEHDAFEYDDVQWSIESSNVSTIVYRVEDQDQILEAFGSTAYAGSTEPLADESYLEVYVDREEGVVSGARFRLRSAESGNDFTYRARYEAVGTADLERPVALGPRTPLEWFWDATYY